MATYRVELSNANVEVELDDPNPITGNNDPQLAASQVVNDSSVSGSTVKDALDWLLGNTSITVHNDLTGIQGGSSGQYYHMTTAEHTSATRDATNAINGLMPAGKMSNWDAAFSHVSMSGADHTFIDQDVTIASTPQFAGATFTAFPLTPSSSPVNDYDVANKKYVDDNAGGGSHLPDVDYLIWNVLATPPAAVEGQVQWDNDFSTLLVQSDKASANSVGYEDWNRVYNLTGADVNNGQPVALNGEVTATLQECFLAQANATGANVNRRGAIGIATHTFASGSDGIITSRGRSRDIDTTGTSEGEVWAVGDDLWLSETLGELTNVKPLLPSSQIRIGKVVTAHATTGIIDVKVQDLSWVGHTQSGDSALERTGFVLKDGVAVDLAESPVSLSIDDVALELTITSTNGFPVYSVNNLLIQAPGDHTIAWTDVEGDHFFWFDETGTMVHSTSFDDRVVLGPWVFIAYLYWDADNSRTILSGPLTETHGLQMDGATHFHFHNTLGSQVLGAGLAIGSLVVAGDGSVAADAQFSVDSGVITDEDLRFAISAVTSTAGLPILYLDGAMEYVREIEQTGFSVVTDTTAGVGVTGRLVYNEWTGTVWQLTTVPVNDYVLCHVFALGSGGVGDKVYAAVGQDVYATATAAKEGATVEMGNLAVKLPFAEVRPIASVIFQTGSYGNAVDARVRPSLDGDYVDWRNDAIPGGSGFTASSHNSLSDRDAANSHPVEAISASGTSYGIIADDGLGALGSTAWLINGTNMAAPTGGQISNVTDPTLAQDVATKAYADSLVNSDHNSLTGLQGGDTNEYYHLTSAQHVGLVGLTNQYQIPVVGASAGVLSESSWSINASTMTGAADSIISASTSLTLTSDVVIDGSLASPGIEFTAPSELTISGGNVTSTQALHLIDTENDDAADDLNSIIATGYSGVIYVRPVSAARVVTLKHGTGNMELGGSDVVMDSLDKWIALTYDSGISKWLIAGGTSTGGGGTSVHNDLTGLQGGTAAEYYHMTSAEHTAATRDATNSVNGLMPTGKLTNWDAASTHVSSDGTDHTYIDQDVRTTAAPQFAGGTFTAFPVTPSQAPTTDYQVANKKYVDDSIFSGVHNDLTSLQGGTTAEYFHLTSAQHTAATRDATNSQNGLMPTAKLTNWDAAFTHVSSTGADHSYLDQAVTIAATPQFAGATFTVFPTTPSAAPTTDYQVANKKYVDDNAGGSPLTTKGDLFTYSTVDARLPIGTNDYVLTADSTQATGMKWAAGGGGGTKAHAYLTMSGSQTTDLTSGDPVQFDQRDGTIGFASGTYRVTLLGDVKYEIEFAVSPLFSSASGALDIQVYDVTNAAYLSTDICSINRINATSSASNIPDNIMGKGVVTPATDIDIEFRISGVGNITQITGFGLSWAMVKEL